MITKTEFLERLIYDANRNNTFGRPMFTPEATKGIYIKREKGKVLIEIHVPDSGIV